MHKPKDWRQSGLKTGWIAILAFALDQVSKLWVLASVELYDRIALIPFFNLTHVYNKGAAFSFLSEAGGWQRWFFALIAISVSGLLLWWMRNNSAAQKLQNTAYALILGGAIGNLLDRLMYGHVVDFIDFYVGNWHWPAFNIADSAICIGAGLLVWDALTDKSDQRRHAQEK